MDESSEENNPAFTVFNNQFLVETILEFATDDIIDNMSFRLVNRTFRNASHTILRKNHRSVKIECIYEKRDKVFHEYNQNHVYINYRPLKLSNVDSYFHLIKNIANVKVNSIYVKDVFLLTEREQTTIHNSITRTLIGNDREIIKTLIGMDEICYHGCEECTKIPQKCLEYGPVRIKNLRESFVEPRFFEKLIIVDYFLDNIANVCVKSSTTKEACLNAVENLINSNVTCKTLVLKLSETRKAETRETTDVYRLEFNTDKLRPMPREVLETILRKWKVQSVVLKFIVETHKKKQAGAWISKKWFSELCLNANYRNVKQSSPELKISEVCVDLKDSYKCANSLQVREPYRRIIFKYGYTVVSNVRRVFLCDKLSIECSHWYQRLKIPIADGVRRLMKVITMENQDNLEVNIRIFPTNRNSKEFFNGLIERQGSNPDIYQEFTILTLPPPLPVFPRSLEPIKKKPYYKYEKKEWIGNAFRMINRRKELIINWEFMIEKEEPIKVSNNLLR